MFKEEKAESFFPCLERKWTKWIHWFFVAQVPVLLLP